MFAKQLLTVIFSQEDDPRGITIRDQMVVIFRPKTALILREKAERRVVIRATTLKECRTAHLRASKEAVKGNLKARILVNSQTQLCALIISFNFACSHLAMYSAIALCFNISGVY